MSEYMAIDHFGITGPGESWKAVENGDLERDGAIPVNPSGGLIGVGHPVGASGVRMLRDAARQVTGQAGDTQVEGARTFATLNIGGSLTTTVSFVVTRRRTEWSTSRSTARCCPRCPKDDDHPYRSGAWRPQSVEYDADDLRRQGELPDDLYGVYLRNTENPLHPAIARYHPFDGDGMIHKVSFRDGHVSYRNRFVRTDGLLAEQEAGRSLWAGLAENPDSAIRADGWGARGRMKDAASTDVVVHAGVAVASFYQCGDLYRLDPLTLNDLGKATWGGRVPQRRSASRPTPRWTTTPASSCSLTTERKPPYLHYGVVDASDRLVHYVPIDLPGPRLPHDMAYTEHYAILNDMPLFWEPELIERGLYAARFHPELPSRLGVIPRRGGGGDIRWFEFDAHLRAALDERLRSRATRSSSRASSRAARNRPAPGPTGRRTGCSASWPRTSCRPGCTAGG